MYSSGLNFQSVNSVERILQASGVRSAIQINGWTVNEGFSTLLPSILRTESPFWTSLHKVPAKANIVKKIEKRLRPSIGFIDKLGLTTKGDEAITHNAVADFPLDLDDPGQEIKAMAGTIEFEHYPRSLADQQNNPWINEVAEKTADMLIEGARKLEMALFRGNATANPLEFNGLDTFCREDHTFAADITTNPPDDISDKLNEICTRASTDRNFMRKITHIYCTGAGSLFLQRELTQKLIYQNLVEIIPGIKVPSILTPTGQVPIISTPYVTDMVHDGYETLTYYLLDRSTLEWNGIYPYGGRKTLEFQVFDISNTIDGLPLLEQRMILLYGCLYANYRGEGIWKLNVKVPSGSTWSPQTW